MANVKISQLPSLSTMTGVAQIPVVADGTTYQITGANLQNYFTGTYGNANVVANLAALGTNPVSTTSNITGGNLLAVNLVINNIRSDDSSFVNIEDGVNVTGDIVASGNIIGAAANIPSIVSVSLDVENISARIGNNGVNIGAGGYNNLVVLPTEVLIQNVPLSVVGNITGSYLFGNGSQLTGLPATYGNANVAANLAAFADNPILTTGNIGAGNINVTTATGNLVFGRASATGSPGINSTSSVTVVTDRFGTPKEWTFGSDGSFTGLGNISGGNVNTNTLVGTGTTIKSTGALNLSATGNIVVNATYINNLSDPVQNQDAATKNYVDTVAQGLNIHQAANLASTQDLATYTGATVTYDNGTSGVGATLSLVGNTLTTLDGTAIPASASTRLLIKNQANAVLNGVYNYTSSSLLTRTTDTDTSAGLAGGDFLFVTSGSTQADTGWIQTTDNVVVGTSNVVFSQFSSAGAYTANTSAGLALNGSIFSAKVDDVTTAFDGSGNIIVKASANLTTPNIGVATGSSLNVTGNITGGNLNATGLSLSGNVVSALNLSSSLTAATTISAVGNISGGNILGGANVNATTHTGTTVSVTGNITGGNIVTAAAVSAASVSASGNITGGNINTGAQVVATGNITGGNLRSTSLSLSGNVISALNASSSIAAGTTISAVGNVTGGNVTTAGLTSTASLSITGNTATVTSANYSIGYLTIPQVTLSANATAGLTDIGKHYYSTTAGNLQVTIPDNANVAFPVGTALSVVVQAGGNVLVVTQPSTTLYLSGNATSGNRVVGSYGMATIMKVASDTWFISGTGVS